MSRSSFILGVALFVVATTMAVMITIKPDTGTPAETATVADTKSSPAQRSLESLPTETGTARNARPSAKLRPRPVASSPRKDTFTVTIPGLQATGSTPSAPERQLIARARKVEQEARENLDRMTAQLDLSHSQRAKLFPILARSSASFDPAMVIGGEFSTTPADVATIEDEIHDELDPDQQVAYEEEVMDDILWWQDIIGQIDADILASTGNGSLEPGVASEPADMPAGEPADAAAKEPDPSGATETDPGAGSSLLDLLGN